MSARIGRIEDVAVSLEAAFSNEAVYLPNTVVWLQGPQEVTGRLRDAFSARTARPDGISLVRLPVGMQIYGAASYLACFEETLIAEQLPPDLQHEPDLALSKAKSVASKTVAIDTECVLIARYGDRTWGHWLGEFLPKIAICERLHPGRFKYAVSHAVTGANDLFGRRALESCAAYGVEPDRLIALGEDSTYHFSSLWAMTSIWSDNVMHPAAARVMRQDVRPIAPSDIGAGRRVALWRGDNSRRQLTNQTLVAQYLKAQNFRDVEIGLLSFSEQVQIFQRSHCLFSILGSSLTGLVYGQPGLSVVAAAPDQFLDSFFYSLMQLNFTRYAEVRGPVVRPDALYRDSDFMVSVADIDEALARLFCVR